MHLVQSRAKVAMLLRYGFTQAEIAGGTGLSKSTVAYHMRNLGEPADERFNRRYDWDEVQVFYDAGNSISKCMLQFGFSRKSFNDARLRGAVKTRPQAMPVDVLLSGPRNRGHVKRRLLSLGLRRSGASSAGSRTGWVRH